MKTDVQAVDASNVKITSIFLEMLDTEYSKKNNYAPQQEMEVTCLT